MKGLVIIGNQSIGTKGLEWHKYRKKPVVISAVKITTPFSVETLEGVMQGKEGDWLVEGIAGELYPYDDYIFHLTYEMVEEAK